VRGKEDAVGRKKKGKQGKRSASPIPEEVRAEALRRVEQFNRETLAGGAVQYAARFQGAFLYLGRSEHGGAPGPLCRLRWTGAMDKWEFAIFKYSSETYDPEEWFFPGAEHVDGTIKGAIRATLEAYPA
jgi:hypothetical protein